MESLISGKHFDKLLKTISKVTGGMLEPTTIRRKAEAYADAKLIETKGDQQAALDAVDTEAMVAMRKIQLLKSHPELAIVSEEYQQLAERAAHRMFHQEVRRQNNLEAITAQAALALDDVESVSENDVNEDWINNFANECQDIGDADMQKIWGKILAGEVASPGSYSRRSLSIVKLLSIEDIKLFESFWRFVWCLLPGLFIAFNGLTSKNDFMTDRGLPQGARMHLETLGLIKTSININIVPEKKYIFNYGSECYLGCNSSNNKIAVFGEALTLAGTELSRMLDNVNDENYKHVVISYFISKGINMTQEKPHVLEKMIHSNEIVVD